MSSEEKSIITEKTARYFIKRNGSDSVKIVLFVIHGYAQLASEFIEDFNFVNDKSILIVAPEGLSKFYFRNKIGASWMTKEGRLSEIRDYVFFLEKVFEDVNKSYDLADAKIFLLGYSQGVHTAVRWFINSKNHFDKLILCSSDFPKDAEFDLLGEKLKYSEMIYIHGSMDEAVREERFNESKILLSENKINFREIKFDGGHRIDEVSVKEAMK